MRCHNDNAIHNIKLYYGQSTGVIVGLINENGVWHLYIVTKDLPIERGQLRGARLHCGALGWRGLNLIKLAYNASRRD